MGKVKSLITNFLNIFVGVLFVLVAFLVLVGLALIALGLVWGGVLAVWNFIL